MFCFHISIFLKKRKPFIAIHCKDKLLCFCSYEKGFLKGGGSYDCNVINLTCFKKMEYNEYIIMENIYGKSIKY